jgi:Domain of unknown function (DUF4150)
MSLPPPTDNYIGEPQYPAPWTTKKPREGLRDTDAALIVSLTPDVCKSPTVPIPYPIVDFCGHDENYTQSVRFTSQKAMALRSNTTHVHGDEPGVGKGVKSGTVGARCHPIEHADQVFAEGSPVIRHLDRCHMNDRNTVGEACFVRDTKSYQALRDDDPVPGSLKWPDKPIQLAYDGTDWYKFLPQEAEPKTKPQPQTKPQTQPAPDQKPKVPGRKGILGRAIGIAVAAELLQELQRQAETQQYVDTAKQFCLDLKTQNDLLAAHAYLYARNIMANTLWSSVPKSNPGRDAAARGIMQNEINNPGTMTAALNGDAAAGQKIEQIAKDAADGKIDTSGAGRCGDNARVDKEKEFPCLVGPYSVINKICPGEAHHIVPDMVYRLGTRPTGAATASTAERIPNAPTLNQGMTVCLTDVMHGSGADGLHGKLRGQLNGLGSQFKPNGTAPMGAILGKSLQSIDEIPGLPEECKKKAKAAAAAQVASRMKPTQPGRVWEKPLPSGAAYDVLSKGLY